jgi:hypothetical protein
MTVVVEWLAALLASAPEPLLQDDGVDEGVSPGVLLLRGEQASDARLAGELPDSP